MNTFQLSAALAAIQSGLRAMEEEDGEISMDVAADFPDEAAALEHGARDVIRRLQEAATLASGAKTQAANLAARAARFEAREAQLRGLLLAVFDTMQWKSREWPEATVSLRAGSPGVVITDETALPDAFVAVKVTRSPMKKEIGAALKASDVVPGAVLANGMPQITIRGT